MAFTRLWSWQYFLKARVKDSIAALQPSRMKPKLSPRGDKLTCEPKWWNSCSLWCADRKFHISEVINMSNDTSASPVPRCMSCEATPQPQLAVALPTDTEYKSGITWLIFHLEPAAPPHKKAHPHTFLCVWCMQIWPTAFWEETWGFH